MNESAKTAEPGQAAADAVKTYIRMHRDKLAADGELLGLLIPERDDIGAARDLQRFLIDRLTAENVRLRQERNALAGRTGQGLGDGVRRFVLDLIDARSFAEAISVTVAAAPAFGADRAAICVEAEGAEMRTQGVRIIPPGTTEAVLGQGGTGAILSGGGEMLLGPAGAGFRSIAAFRVKIGRDAPAALLVLGAAREAAFEDDSVANDLRFAAKALERAIRAWLDLPKI